MIGLKSKSNLLILVVTILTIFALFISVFLITKNEQMNNHVKILAMYESRVKQDKLKQIEVKKQTVTKKVAEDNISFQKQKLEEQKKLAQEELKKKKEEEKKQLEENKQKEQKQKDEELKKKTLENNSSNQNNFTEKTEVTSNASLNQPTGNMDIATQLKQSGLGDVQVNAIIANLNRESTMNPNANNGVGNQGLAQWGGSRLNNLKSSCGGLGTANCQINFMINEMNSGINGFSLQKFNSYGDVNSANAYFKAHYEGAA